MLIQTFPRTRFAREDFEIKSSSIFRTVSRSLNFSNQTFLVSPFLPSRFQGSRALEIVTFSSLEASPTSFSNRQPAKIRKVLAQSNLLHPNCCSFFEILLKLRKTISFVSIIVNRTLVFIPLFPTEFHESIHRSLGTSSLRHPSSRISRFDGLALRKWEDGQEAICHRIHDTNRMRRWGKMRRGGGVGSKVVKMQMRVSPEKLPAVIPSSPSSKRFQIDESQPYAEFPVLVRSRHGHRTRGGGEE